MNRATLFLLLFCLVSVQVSFAQSNRKGKDYAFLFYVNNFQDPAWPDLPETRSEVLELKNELENNYNFQVEIIPNPTRKQIIDKIKSINRRSFRKDDQIFFFFSSHGHFNQNVDRGFLIPADGKSERNDPYGDSWVSYDDLGSRITYNRSEHILLALDACYSGAFGDRYKGKPGQAPWDKSQDCNTQVRQALTYASRLYFTSGSRDQRTPAKSKFASLWLAVLRDGAQRGVVRTNDIRYHLGTISYPTPEGGSFTSKHQAGGDFVFVHKNACRSDDSDALHWKNVIANPTEINIRQHLDKHKGCPHFDQALDMFLATKSSSDPPKKPPLHTSPPDNMVFIQGGIFQMGSYYGDNDEKPVHQVTLSDFYLARNEVTFSEYDVFCNATGNKLADDEGLGRDQFPVINVSWSDAIAYCNWKSEQEKLQPVYTITGGNNKNPYSVTANWNANGYRLPTEAEWEYAARSRGGKDRWAGTSNSSNLANFGNFCDNNCKKHESGNDGYKNTAPVGSFSPNKIGLYDMSGNVLEWCWDWKGKYPSNRQTNPKGSKSGTHRIVRGGSWYLAPTYLRCSARSSYSPTIRGLYVGFRLSRTTN